MITETHSDTQGTQSNAQHNTSADTNTWHVVQQTEGHCEICSQAELDQLTSSPKTWGPFASRATAIAKRVGLIRAGKCLPQ